MEVLVEVGETLLGLHRGTVGIGHPADSGEC